MFILKIFVTVGSRKYPFDRLFKKLDELFDEKKIDDEIFAQIGTSSYKPRNYQYKDYITQEEFQEYVNNSDLVISHGASGSIMKALNAGKKVIAVTRLEKYGEHINDHQIQNNEAFSSNNYVLMASLELDDLDQCINKIKNNTDGTIPWENKDPLSIVKIIDKFIQENFDVE